MTSYHMVCTHVSKTNNTLNLLNILLHALFICCEADKRHSLRGGVQNLAFWRSK